MRIQRRPNSTLWIAMWIFSLFLAEPMLAQAPAQGRPAVQPPRRPSLSPYLNLGIPNSGALPSFQAFVVPRIEQHKQQINQFALQAKTTALEKSALVDANLRQTGGGGNFQNFSHYFPVQRARSKP